MISRGLRAYRQGQVVHRQVWPQCKGQSLTIFKIYMYYKLQEYFMSFCKYRET